MGTGTRVPATGTRLTGTRVVILLPGYPPVYYPGTRVIDRKVYEGLTIFRLEAVSILKKANIGYRWTIDILGDYYLGTLYGSQTPTSQPNVNASVVTKTCWRSKPMR